MEKEVETTPDDESVNPVEEDPSDESIEEDAAEAELAGVVGVMMMMLEEDPTIELLETGTTVVLTVDTGGISVEDPCDDGTTDVADSFEVTDEVGITEDPPDCEIVEVAD